MTKAKSPSSNPSCFHCDSVGGGLYQVHAEPTRWYIGLGGSGQAHYACENCKELLFYTKHLPEHDPVIPPPVQRSALSSFRMVAGNENKYSIVIDEGQRKNWVGIGWVDEGPASELDRLVYPTVIE